MPVSQDVFGTTPDGMTVERFRLRNHNGLEVAIITYGATITAWHAPDRNGNLADIVLGFNELAPYLGPHPYFGALIGRYGNRIARGSFTLHGLRYPLVCNNGPNHLHGGGRGFSRVHWQARALADANVPGVELRYLSRDGEEGYPGNLEVTVTYTLNAQNELQIDYQATTDRDTVLNLTNHSYFNLAGSGDTLGHQLQIMAPHFLPVDANLIPLGELRPVAGTPMDFRTPVAVGARIGEDDEQLQHGNGYDHTWVFDKPAGALALVARLIDPASGRVLEVETTEPGVQFYSGNRFDPRLIGKHGAGYPQHAGLCLETQHFPDSPNQPAFPSTLLRPGETYQQTTIYRCAVVAPEHTTG